MSTAEELIQEVQNALSGMGDDLEAIGDFTGLIAVLLAAPDLEDKCPGLHWLVMVIREHLRAVRDRQVSASRAIHRLANS